VLEWLRDKAGGRDLVSNWTVKCRMDLSGASDAATIERFVVMQVTSTHMVGPCITPHLPTNNHTVTTQALYLNVPESSI
jgi:hypothetical protein